MSLFGMMTAARALGFYTQQGHVLQNNLANQSTNGFKFDRIIAAFDPVSGAPVLNRSIDMSQGTFERTDKALDFAIEGDGFFVVQTPSGERLTRNGAFQIREGNRFLVDGADRPVLGKDGPIVIEGDSLEVGVDGIVSVDGVEVDTLRVVNVPNPGRLQKEGVSLFVASEPLIDQPLGTTTKVRQFGLEESNVNGIQGIGDLITVQRNFAFSMNAMQSMDSMLETVTNSIGRL